MKRLLIISLMLLTACGKSLSNNPIKPINPKAPGACYDITNGKWQNIYNAGYRLTIDDQCFGSSTYCNEVFTYHPQPNGTIILLVSATNGGPECMPVGATTCTAAIMSGRLNVNCGVTGKAIEANYDKM